MRLYYLVALVALTLGACHRPDDNTTCLPSAAVSSLRFRLLDATSHQDLFLSGNSNGLITDSVTATQPCYNGKQTAHFDLYTIPNTSNKGYTFTFSNLRNAGLSEADTCFSINVKWNSHDSSVIRWHYHLQQVGDCNEQVVDFVSFNNNGCIKVDDGMYTYWELLK